VKNLWVKRIDNSGGSVIIKGNNKMAADNEFTVQGKNYTVTQNPDAVKAVEKFAKETLEIGLVQFDNLQNANVIQPMLSQLEKLKNKHNKHFFQILVEELDDNTFAEVSPDLALHLNAKYMNSTEATKDFLQRMKNKHLLPKGYENTEYIITHEFMHFISRDDVDNTRSAIYKLIPNADKRNKNLPSLNSKRSVSEYVADVMAMVEHGNTNVSGWNNIYSYFFGGDKS
jgi:hypothetical protein